MTTDKVREITGNELVEHIQSSPLVQAAITEAVHRFYYDRFNTSIKRDREELKATNAGEVLSNLWNLQPNWRYVIEKAAKRYHTSNTNAVSIHGKPDTIIPFKIEIEIK